MQEQIEKMMKRKRKKKCNGKSSETEDLFVITASKNFQKLF